MRAHFLGGLSLLVAGFVAVACSPDDLSTQPELFDVSNPRLASEARLATLEAAIGYVRPDQWARVRIVGDIHAEAMRDLNRNWEEYVHGPGSIQQRICRGAFRITMKYHSRAYEAAGLPLPARSDAIREVEEVITGSPGCEDFRAPRLMSLFAGVRDLFSNGLRVTPLRASSLPTPSSMMLEDTLWYGEAVEYMEDIESLWNSDSDNTSEQDAEAVVAEILPEAQGIHVGDYEVVLAIADGLISSADDWGSYPEAEELCDPYDETEGPYCMHPPESLFVPGWKKAFVVVASDVGGGVGGAITGCIAGLFGGPGASVALGVVGATYGFVGGSSAAALALILVE